MTEAGQVVEAFVKPLLDGNIANADLNALIEYLHTDGNGTYRQFGSGSNIQASEVDAKVRGLAYLILSSPLYQLA